MESFALPLAQAHGLQGETAPTLVGWLFGWLVACVASFLPLFVDWIFGCAICVSTQVISSVVLYCSFVCLLVVVWFVCLLRWFVSASSSLEPIPGSL